MAATSDRGRQLVVFALGGCEYGFPIDRVREIIRFVEPRPMPGAPPGVVGVIDIRGHVVPVVDLAQRLASGGDHPDTAKIVVVEVGDAVVGTVVDEVAEVLTVAADRTEPPPPIAAAGAPYLEAVAKLDERLLVILDVDRLLSAEGGALSSAA